MASTKLKWKVTQGTSRAVVVGTTYADAKARAAQIGFDNPDSIVLVTV